MERGDLSDVERGTSVMGEGDISDVERGDLNDMERVTSEAWRGGTSVTWRGGDLSDRERGDLRDVERGDLLHGQQLVVHTTLVQACALERHFKPQNHDHSPPMDATECGRHSTCMNMMC